LAVPDRSRPTGLNPGEFAVHVTGRDGQFEVHLRGELDMSTAPKLREELARLASGDAGSQVVVDLSGLGFVDSTGLSVLINGMKELREQGGDMALRAPTPSTLRVLEITGLTEVFSVL